MYYKPVPLSNSPIYRKALEIFTLSKNISNYLVHDLSKLGHDGQEHPDIYFTGDIVQKSVSMFPEIAHAESKTFSEEKRRHAASVLRLTKAIYKNCERLEHSVPNGKEFIALLRNELNRFKKMQRNWTLTL